MPFRGSQLCLSAYRVQVISEDVGAVVLHYGAVPKAAQPCQGLPAFPQAATSNHEANDDSLLHETREFWARLQPESLVPLLQSVSHTSMDTSLGMCRVHLCHFAHTRQG